MSSTRLVQRKGTTVETARGVRRLTIGDKLTAAQASYGRAATVTGVSFNGISARKVHAIYVENGAVIYVATGPMRQVVHPAHVQECEATLASNRRWAAYQRARRKIEERMGPLTAQLRELETAFRRENA